MFDLTVLPFPRDFFATFLMHMFRDIYEFPVKIQHRRVNYAVVNSRMDYCSTVLVGARRTITDQSQRMLNTAARFITSTRKFDRGLRQILHDQLHWLDVPDRVLFKLAVTVYQCLNGRAPLYPVVYWGVYAGIRRIPTSGFF